MHEPYFTILFVTGFAAVFIAGLATATMLGIDALAVIVYAGVVAGIIYNVRQATADFR
jgi:hypothetical protein